MLFKVKCDKMRGEPVELACPFCDKGKIQCWYIPGAISIKKTSTSTLGRMERVRKTSDIWLIKSGCPICGKTQKEVEKKLKEDGII